MKYEKLTGTEAAKLQKHNADLVKENETLTRDNAELRGQIAAIKQAAISNTAIRLPCAVCKYVKVQIEDEPCAECAPQYKATFWSPPSAEN